MTKKQISKDFIRGARAAAGVAATYNATSSHPFRLDDCVLAKLNILPKRTTVRRNRRRQPRADDMWFRGFASGLAEMHRRLSGGADSAGVREAARNSGLTLNRARLAGLSAYDLRELKKAGVP